MRGDLYLEQNMLGVDMSDDDVAIPFGFVVPDGTYYFSGFLDDDRDAQNGAPDRGDLVPAEGMFPTCVEVVVDGADVDGVVLDLNFTMLWP